MKKIDIVLVLISGVMANWLAYGFLDEFNIRFGFWLIPLFFVLPGLSLLFFYLAEMAKKKHIFIFQASKHILTGIFATVVDLKFFQLFLAMFPALPGTMIIPKAFSFLIATSIKYIGNKYWTFQKLEKEGMPKEFLQFFAVTFAGLSIDIGVFFFLTKLVGPQFGMSYQIWAEASVVFAGGIAGIWNFTADKFLVFKK